MLSSCATRRRACLESFRVTAALLPERSAKRFLPSVAIRRRLPIFIRFAVLSVRFPVHEPESSDAGQRTRTRARPRRVSRTRRPEICIRGPAVSTVKERSAGLSSKLPSRSPALTRNACRPSASRRITVYGEEHGAKEPVLRLHSNVAPSSVAKKTKRGVLSLVMAWSRENCGLRRCGVNRPGHPGGSGVEIHGGIRRPNLEGMGAVLEVGVALGRAALLPGGTVEPALEARAVLR